MRPSYLYNENTNTGKARIVSEVRELIKIKLGAGIQTTIVVCHSCKLNLI